MVTGYQSVKNPNMAGSVSTVKGEDLGDYRNGVFGTDVTR